MRNIIICLLLGILAVLLISGCESGALKGTPLDGTSGSDDLLVDVEGSDDSLADPACADVTCEGEQTCVSGDCVCGSGLKECNDQCIDENSCCSNDDCGSGSNCESRSCVFDCSNLVCAEGMTCSTSQKRCVCPTNYNWCERQQKCIPADHCCSRFDCRNNERCTDTITTAEICVEESGRACKIFNTVGRKTLTLPGGDYKINLTRVSFLDSIDLVVNNESFTLGKDQRKSLGDSTVYIQKFREVGGECRDFDRGG